ncbi:MAG: hypothetical protein ACLQBK_02210, partial [Candidatus Sulfotelmatobacter sp.]
HRPGGCGRLAKPDISLATKSGHFNLLRTHTVMDGSGLKTLCLTVEPRPGIQHTASSLGGWVEGLEGLQQIF